MLGAKSVYAEECKHGGFIGTTGIEFYRYKVSFKLYQD